MRKSKAAVAPAPVAEATEQEAAPVKTVMVPAISTNMSLENALKNVTGVIKSVQVSGQAHDLLSESLRVIRKKCGLPLV